MEARTRTGPFLAIVGVVVGGVAALAYLNPVRRSLAVDTFSVEDTWEDLSLSRFYTTALEGEWTGQDEHAALLLRFQKSRSAGALLREGRISAYFVELGEVRLNGTIELRLLASGLPPIRCIATIENEAAPEIRTITEGDGWPRCPFALRRPADGTDVAQLRAAIDELLKPGAPALVWREVAPDTYQRGMMGPGLVFAAFPDDDMVREPMREEANLRATVWTLEDQRANRAPWK